MMNSEVETAARPLLAAHHWSIFDLDVADACRWAAAHGYAGLDLAIGDLGTGPRIDLTELADDPDACDRLAAAASDAGVVYTDRLTGVTILPGIRGDADRDEVFAVTADELRRYVSIGADNDLEVSIEAHVESVTDTPERTLAMLDAVPGLTLTLDYSHFIHPGFSQTDIEPLNAHARHFHVRQAARGRLAIEVGAGVIDHRRLLGDLAAAGFSGSLATEYVDAEWYDQNLVDTVAENAAMRDEIAGLLDDFWPEPAP
jgi:sugar phosphate isomerase/epimerase